MACVPMSISCSPKLPLVFPYLNRNMVDVFCFLLGWITWRISAQAEVSSQSTGLKFCCGYMTNFISLFLRLISLGTKYEIACEESRENQAAILFPAFQPGLKKSPRNRQFDFKRICFRSRAEISARLAGLKFQLGLKFSM